MLQGMVLLSDSGYRMECVSESESEMEFARVRKQVCILPHPEQLENWWRSEQM